MQIRKRQLAWRERFKWRITESSSIGEIRQMQKQIVISITLMVVLLAASPIVSAQTSQAPNWLPCPQCMSNEATAEARAETADLSFDARDLSGVWGPKPRPQRQLSVPPPPFTTLGQEKYDATRSDETPDGESISNSNDPILICDPMGWPRLFTYNYGFEFVQMPDRMFQFFEWGHSWRTVWTDGRTLLDNPDPRWLGYSVGRWEGDTFVVESNGFDERSWVTEDRQDRRFGYPHTEDMRLEERYRRVSHNEIEATLTVIDPETYTEPWVTTSSIFLTPGSEIGEYFCVPSDSEYYNNRILLPSHGLTSEN